VAKIYRFGPYELNLAGYELRKRNRRIRLPASAIEFLHLLVCRSGELVTREEIAARLWSEPESVDVAHGINTAVNRLRTVLGDDPASPAYIETVVSKGYRFIADVTAVENPAEDVFVPASHNDLAPAPSLIAVPPPMAGISNSVPAVEAKPAEFEGRPTEAATSSLSYPEPYIPKPTGTTWPFGRRAGVLIALGLLVAGGSTAIWLEHLKSTPAAASVPVPQGMSFVLATFNDGDNRITAEAISHLGEAVAYSDQSGVSVRSVAAGLDRLLPSPRSLRVERIAWYPEDTQLLVSGVESASEKPQVWVVSLKAEAPHLLMEDAGQAVVSTDGSKVAFTRHSNAELWVADSRGQNQRRLVAGAEGDTISSLIWAPQGNRLVYVRRRTSAHPPEENSPLGELQSQFQWDYRSVDGTTGNLLAEERNARFDSAYLLPDGRMFFPQNDYALEHPVAHLSTVKTELNTGRFLSEPRLISDVNGDRAFSLSASDDGQLVGMVVERRSPEVFVGKLQPGPALFATHRLTYHASDAYPHAWTPDGNAVVYESNDTGKYVIFKRRLDAPAPEMLARLPDDSVLPEVSPDGKWVLFAQFPAPRVHADAIFRVSVNGGRPEQVPTPGAFDEFDCPVSNRGTCVLRETIGKEFVYYALDPLQGKGKELGRTEWMPNVLSDWGLSPDSSMVALANHDPARPFIRIVTLSSPAKSTTVDIPLPGYGTILKPTWSPDARGFYVESKNDIGYSLLYVDRAGHAKVLKDTPNPIWGVPTRDGTKLAFVDQSASRNVWIGHASAP
jgi:DNA-binding winged helix-turn-helix (wHTH) protein/Tol biopolymer transport system component